MLTSSIMILRSSSVRPPGVPGVPGFPVPGRPLLPEIFVNNAYTRILHFDAKHMQFKFSWTVTSNQECAHFSPFSPGTPGFPASPGGPGAPFMPGIPGSPFDPLKPGAPGSPCKHTAALLRKIHSTRGVYGLITRRLSSWHEALLKKEQTYFFTLFTFFPVKSCYSCVAFRANEAFLKILAFSFRKKLGQISIYL